MYDAIKPYLFKCIFTIIWYYCVVTIIADSVDVFVLLLLLLQLLLLLLLLIVVLLLLVILMLCNRTQISWRLTSSIMPPREHICIQICVLRRI